MKDGESAFLVSGSSMTLGRVVERYAEEDGNIYDIPSSYTVTTDGSKEYTLPLPSAFTKMESYPVKLKFNAASGSSLAGVKVSIICGNFRNEAVLDSNGEATVAVMPLNSERIYATIEDVTLYNEAGERTTKIPYQTFTFMLMKPETSFEATLEEAVKEEVHLKFTSEGSLDGVTGVLSGKGDRLKFKLDASGEVTLPMQTLTAGSYSVTIDAAYKDGRYISPQSFSFSGTEFTGQIKSQKR